VDTKVSPHVPLKRKEPSKEKGHLHGSPKNPPNKRKNIRGTSLQAEETKEGLRGKRGAGGTCSPRRQELPTVTREYAYIVLSESGGGGWALSRKKRKNTLGERSFILRNGPI